MHKGAGPEGPAPCNMSVQRSLFSLLLERRQEYRCPAVPKNGIPARRGRIIRIGRVVVQVHPLYLVMENPHSGLISGGWNQYIQAHRVRHIMGLAVDLIEIVKGIVHVSGRRSRDRVPEGMPVVPFTAAERSLSPVEFSALTW